jgi:hypothetical protein
VAVTFVDWEDLHKWTLINRALDFGQPEPTETYSSSPHLFDDLGIPEEARGRLKPTPAVTAPENRQSAGQRRGSSTRTRRRTRNGSTPSEDATGQAASLPGADSAAKAGSGTHDGGGPQHRDGKSAPRRRRNRSRGGTPPSPTANA